MRVLRSSGFTLVEVLVSAGIVAVVGLVLGSFSWTSLRLVARNLATNHSHGNVLASQQRLLSDLHASGSAFKLVDFNGTTFTDAATSVTADVDVLTSRSNSTTHQNLSTRANAVRYWQVAGGPYKLTSSTIPANRSLTYDFGPAVGGQLPYIPQVNDKLWIPVISREFKIVAVTSAPTAGSPSGTFTIHDTAGIGFTLDTSGSNVTTSYFFRQAGYSVSNGQLRYHPQYPPVAPADTIVVRNNLTSPRPFALLYESNTSSITDGLDLHVSMEFYDSAYTAQRFQNGTTTLQSVISLRNQPAHVSLASTPL